MIPSTPTSSPPPLPPPSTPPDPPVPPVPPNGILVLDKPAGISSAGVLNRLKYLLPRKTKLGHAGTLDPFATGVLLALIGKATKRCESLMGSPKTYLATLKLGATTETLDPESSETLVPGPVPTLEEVQKAFAAYAPLHPGIPGGVGLDGVGVHGAGVDVVQVPPAYSALKVSGRPAYALARAGKPVELAPRTVHIYSLTLLSYDYPHVTLETTVGRGFYVRSLARDLGTALGSAGYLTQLRRTRVGPFAAENASLPSDLTPDNLFLRLQP